MVIEGMLIKNTSSTNKEINNMESTILLSYTLPSISITPLTNILGEFI